MSGGNRSTSHSALLQVCEAYLQARGAWTFRVHGHLGQRPGVADLLACLHGRLIAVEGKTGRGVLSAVQQAERARLEEAGAIFVEARQVDDVEAALLAAGLVECGVLWPKREG